MVRMGQGESCFSSFQLHGLLKEVTQEIIPQAQTHGPFQVEFGSGQETGSQFTVSRKAQAVAGAAAVPAHGADEAQFPPESRHSEIPGRPGRGFPG